jgi:hypothetical protein
VSQTLRHGAPRSRLRRGPAVALTVTFVIAGSPVAVARARPHVRACGRVHTREPNTGSVKIFAVSKVGAQRLSCTRARRLVRTWHSLCDEGKLPNRAAGKIRKSVLVYKRWGRPYRVRGFVCRSMAFAGRGPVERERVTCGAHAGLITWYESGRVG